MDLREKSRTQSDSDQIRHTLTTTRNEIESVKKRIKITIEEIEKANTLLRALQTTEKELQHTAEAAARLLSPFTKVPADILGTIVEHVSSSSIVIPDTNEGIWPLTHVCSSWRTAILSLPHLWSSFTFTDHGDLHKTVSMLATILERSGSRHPLSFRIPIVTSIEFQIVVMRLLVEHSERWKSVHINTAVGPSMLLRLRNRLPQLGSLTLELIQPGSGGERDWHDSEAERGIFEYAPKLVKLEIPPAWGTFPVEFRFPVGQLRELRSVWDPTTRKVGLWDPRELEQFRGLKRLDIGELGWNWDLNWVGYEAAELATASASGSDGEERIELGSVTHLTLENPHMLLRVFRFPALTSLDLCDVLVDGDSLSFFGKVLSGFMGEQLRRISLTLCARVDGGCVSELLMHEALKGVEKLELRQRRSFENPRLWIEPLLSRSTYRPSNRTHVAGSGREEGGWIVLPCLRHFVLEFVYQLEGKGIFRALEEFIISRTSLVDRIRQAGEGDEYDGNRAMIPFRLEDVQIRYAEVARPITLENFQRFGEEMIGVLE